MLVQPQRLADFTSQIFLAAGCNPSESQCISNNLVDANLCGHDSHGVIRIMQYIEYLRAGTICPGKQMEVVGETSTSIVVDGHLGWGQVICGQTMEAVARKAKQSGLAMSAIRNSGHMGRVGYWAEQLANEDLISLHFLNTTGKGMMAVPFGGTDRRLSLCAMAACVPVEQRPPLLLDFTTTVMAEGKLRVALNQGVAVPPGTIVDKQGQPTTDPKAFYDGGALLPIAAHKGHGLNMIADILSGALSGGGCTAPDVTTLQNTLTTIAIDPTPLVDRQAYFTEIKRYCDWVTDSPPQTPGNDVLAPGEMEHQTRLQRKQNGILLDDTTWKQIIEIAQSFGLSCDDSAMSLH